MDLPLGYTGGKAKSLDELPAHRSEGWREDQALDAKKMNPKALSRLFLSHAMRRTSILDSTKRGTEPSEALRFHPNRA